MLHAVTSVRLLYPGESDVCCGVHQEEHLTLDLSTTAIATLYGMREDSLRICHRSVYLPFVNGRVVVPSFVVETYNCLARWNGVLECHVDGEPTPVWCNAEGHVRIWNFKRGFRVRFRSAAEKTKKLVGRRDRDLADLSSGFEVRFRREEDS